MSKGKEKKVVNCEVCGKAIPAIRLELIPDTTFCVSCSAKHAPKVFHDPDVICARSSLNCSNGFGPSD